MSTGAMPRLTPRRLTLILTIATAGLLAIGGLASVVSSPDGPDDASLAAPSATASGTPTPAASPTAAETPTPSPSVTARPTPSPTPSAEPTPDAATLTYGTAEAAALELPVKGRAPKTSYSREQFGRGWIDVDRNGCDTRNDMLRLRLDNLSPAAGCKIQEGDLADPFTATWIHFEYGGASEVDIDHLVALSDAWQKGAATWEFAQRVAFANDPLNLEPVDAGANRQKGDGDAATWLPPNKDFRCEYVARQIAVKKKYGLWVTQAELDAFLRVLDSCPNYALPGPGDQPIIADNVGGQSAPAQTTEPAQPKPEQTTEAPAPEPEPEPATDPRYPYCKDLPAGYGPYYKGVDPEYEWYTDRDGDGVVCE